MSFNAVPTAILLRAQQSKPQQQRHGSGLKALLQGLQTRRKSGYLPEEKEKRCSNSCFDSSV
jgi:hypothetical protein